MTALSVIKLSLELLGKEDLLKLTQFGGTVATASEEEKKEIDRLVKCLNLVVSEIAEEFFPLKKIEKIKSVDGVILFSSFSCPVFSVVSIHDSCGRKMKFKTFPDHIKVDDGEMEICFEYKPKIIDINGEIENFYGKVSERIFAYGVAMEFCLISSMADEAMLFDKRFKDSLFIAGKKRCECAMPKRRFI
ncbi:MAG: hypothetical protein RR400_02170 [Clostridia bacterium]